MKTIVITPEVQVKGEIETCNLLLKSNIERLHVRKPFATEESMRDYLTVLDRDHYSKISLHSHHHLVDELRLGGKHFKSHQEVNATGTTSKSFHSFDEIENEATSLSYGFLSPIFDSISKVCYAGEFELAGLKHKLKNFHKFPLYALGGIDNSKVQITEDLGFHGVAILGAIWNVEGISERMKMVNALIDA